MKSNSMTIPILRPDFQYILDLIPTGFRVLDLGCGDGDLLYLLKKKGVRGQGIEKNEDCIYKCIERGVIVHHGDLDEGLKHHIKKSFDYVILNQTIQETHNPGNIIKDSLRIGKKVIVVFPNFAHWKNRLQILFKGITPVSDNLPYRWYNTPNLHFLSITDFEEFCAVQKFKIEDHAFFSDKNRIETKPNLFAKLALFVLSE
ncbi:MAG: methionine biosynthesis protein MetW [Leptospiraceae bacterium]|nr:methionine biosynthesis protein MetW [Leptospiraceae bacterium]MBK9501660.1 methionine biosynthesis protein MetW [Leptospiraceae bacterium]MBP9163589.1 methionine biosynthesis protein MetW [Leptospiraceae bacterium]